MPQSLLLLTSEFPPFRGGIATYTAELAAAAERLGHEVTVLAPDLAADQRRCDRQFRFDVVRYPGTCRGNRRTPSAMIAAVRLVEGRSFDILHATCPVFADALTLWRKIRRRPFIRSLLGSEILMAFNSLEGRLSRLLGSFEAPETHLAISEYTRSLFLDRFPAIPSTRTRTTLLGVSDFWFEPKSGFDGVARYGIDPAKKILLTAARITPRKGHDLVLEALRQLPVELKSELCYVVVGTGQDRRYAELLETMARDCGVEVVFAGPVSRHDLRGWYDTAWLYCMPGKRDPNAVEGFGLAYLEAAARGLPSVASAIGGVPEVIDDEKTGLLLPEVTATRLAEALTRLLTDESLRPRLAGATQPWARRFTWEACAKASYGG